MSCVGFAAEKFQNRKLTERKLGNTVGKTSGIRLEVKVFFVVVVAHCHKVGYLCGLSTSNVTVFTEQAVLIAY